MSSDAQSPTQDSDSRSSRVWLQAAVCLLLAVLFAVCAVTSWQLGLGSIAAPEAGLWPLIASLLGLSLTAVLCVRVIRNGGDREAELFRDVHWLNVGVFVAALVGFLAVYPLVGFLAAAIPMTFVLLKFAAQARFIPSLVVAGVAPVVLYMIFREVLNVRF